MYLLFDVCTMPCEYSSNNSDLPFFAAFVNIWEVIAAESGATCVDLDLAGPFRY